jgi:hypothetical protein
MKEDTITGEELINFLCVVLYFFNKIYVQSMYTKCITKLILDLAHLATDPVEPGILVRYSDAVWVYVSESRGRRIVVRRGNDVSAGYRGSPLWPNG